MLNKKKTNLDSENSFALATEIELMIRKRDPKIEEGYKKNFTEFFNKLKVD